MYLPRISHIILFFKYRTLEHGILEHSNIRTFEPLNKSTFEFQRTFEHRTFEYSKISEHANIRTFEQSNISEHSNIEHPNIRILANIRTFELSNIWILANIRTSNISKFKKQRTLSNIRTRMFDVWWPLVVISYNALCRIFIHEF